MRGVSQKVSNVGPSIYLFQIGHGSGSRSWQLFHKIDFGYIDLPRSYSLPRLQELVVPTLDPGSQAFVDLGFTSDGVLLPETSRVWQFSFTPLKVEGAGPTGELHQGCVHLAALLSTARLFSQHETLFQIVFL